MPYNRLEELPNNIKDPLPVGAQRMWMRAFNSVVKDCTNAGKSTKDCEKIGRIAGWVSVKTKYKKGKDGKWEKKENKD